MEPTIDTEAPTDTPAEEPGEITVDGAELNAAGDEHTVSIKDYSSIRKRVDITVAGGTELTSDGKTTAKEGTALTITVKMKDGVNNYKIKSVKSGSTEATGSSGTYTLALGSEITADAEVEIALAEVYTVEVSSADSFSITLDKSLNAAAGEAEDATVTISDGASKVIEKGADLKFTITGYTATDNDRLQAFYLADHSTDETDLEPIEVVETEAGEAAKTKVYTCSVSSAVTGSLDEHIKIVLVKDEKKEVTIDAGSDVRVSYRGIKTEGTTETEVWVDGNDPTAIKKAFAGNPFKFKAVGINSRKISKVTVNGESIDLSENGEYEITVEDVTTVEFETVVDSVSSNTLTFTLEGDEDSAEAEITSLTNGESALTTADEIKAFLGLKSANLEAGTAVNVPKTVSALEVKVTPKAGWGLKPVTGEDSAPANRLYKFAETADAENGVVAISEAMTVAAATEVTKADAAHYFKVTLDDAGEEEANRKLSNLVITEVKDQVTKKDTTSESGGVYYAVAENVQTVTFSLDVKEGYELKLAPDTAVKSIVSGAVANGKAAYTVTLFASKLTGTTDTFADAQEITASAAEITYAVTQDPESSGNFKITYESKATTEGAEYEPVEEGNLAALPYGVALRATVVPTEGARLDKVTYTMGGDPVDVATDYNEESRRIEAVVDIKKLIGDVTIKVESGEDYKLMLLADATDSPLDPDLDGIYTVEYGEKYLVGVKRGASPVPAKNVRVVVKDASGNTVAMTNPIIESKRSINLANKSLAGQEITADIFVKGETDAIGTYILNVKKKTTALTVNGGEAINQDVDSVAYYDIETDGELPTNGNVTKTGDIASLITTKIIGGRLQVIVAPAATTDVITETKTGTGEAEVITKTPKEATITVTSPDDEDVKATVKVTANPLFDKDAKPTVSEIAAADTVINVSVGMAGVKKPRTGSVWYEVTATAKADGTGDEPKRDATKLKQTYTTTVRKTGDSQRIDLPVGISSQLGEGAAWDYSVTAKLIYKEDRIESADTVEATEVSDALATGTKSPLFEDSLKLKKAKGAPSALYTGQDGDIVIAEPQWTKKFSSYKIVSDQIYDSSYYYDEDDYYNTEGLPVGVNSDGNIVVKGVPESAALGKHTITVVATADETGKYNEMGEAHTMYASRATITVNVVKGINDLDIVTPTHTGV